MAIGVTGNMKILFFNKNIFSTNRKRDACKDNLLTISFFIHFNIQSKECFDLISSKQFIKFFKCWA